MSSAETEALEKEVENLEDKVAELQKQLIDASGDKDSSEKERQVSGRDNKGQVVL